MTNLGKGLVGAAVTSIVAIAAHAFTGQDYVAGLEEDGQAALAEAGAGEGFGFTMQNDPLSRVALLNGPEDVEARAAAEGALAAVPGISSVRWAEADEIAAQQAVAADRAAADAGGDADGNLAGVEAGDDAALAGSALPANASMSPEASACQDAVDGGLEGQMINFRSGSAYMSLASHAIVQQVADAMSECDSSVSVIIAGHTDANGSEAINQSMSQERADRVAASLAEKGIDTGRITSIGLGSSQPLMEGTSPEANAANRRIIFTMSAGSGTGEE